MTFAELGLPPELLAALAKQKITAPTPIQIAAMPVLLKGQDGYLSAPTGTGKTLAYLLPLFSRIAREEAATQIVIVAPTHELAIQIQRQCGELAVNAGWAIRSVLLVGGTSMERQIEKLKKKPQVLIGTLGRILELLAMGKVKAGALRGIVIDEADRMWIPENMKALRTLIAAAPAGRQLVFASATPQAADDGAFAAVAPQLVRVQAGAAPVNENIEHFYLVCEERDKPAVLRKALHALRPERAMVFVAGVAIIGGLGFALWIDGAFTRHKFVTASVEKHRNDLAQLQRQNAELSRILKQDPDAEGRKHVYYLSLEFLIGRLFADVVENLRLTETVRAALGDLGVDLDRMRRAEPDAALGNGGLGRLAACLMESMASLAIPACGYGIRYDHGLFRQVIRDGWQQEYPEDWLAFGNPWEFARPEVVYDIGYGGRVQNMVTPAGRIRPVWHPAETIEAPPLCGVDQIDVVPPLRALAWPQQIADKVCAIFEQHRGGYSSRARDLADVGMIGRTGRSSNTVTMNSQNMPATG